MNLSIKTSRLMKKPIPAGTDDPVYANFLCVTDSAAKPHETVRLHRNLDFAGILLRAVRSSTVRP